MWNRSHYPRTGRLDAVVFGTQYWKPGSKATCLAEAKVVGARGGTLQLTRTEALTNVKVGLEDGSGKVALKEGRKGKRGRKIK